MDCGGDGGRWSKAVGCCFLECNLVMCFKAVKQLVWAETWVDSKEVPEGAVVAEFIQWQLGVGAWEVGSCWVDHLPSFSLEAEHSGGSVWGEA